MTITTNPTREEYTAAAGQTVFNFNFKIYSDQDLDVYVTPAGQDVDDDNDLTTNYVIDPSSIFNDVGGFLTLTTPTTLNDLVTIVSGIAENRIVDYQNNGDFRPPVVNNDFDRAVSLIKQLSDVTGRSLKFQEAQQSVFDLFLPPPSAGQMLIWRDDEKGLENIDPAGGGLSAGPGILIAGGTVSLDYEVVTVAPTEVGETENGHLWFVVDP